MIGQARVGDDVIYLLMQQGIANRLIHTVDKFQKGMQGITGPCSQLGAPNQLCCGLP